MSLEYKKIDFNKLKYKQDDIIYSSPHVQWMYTAEDGADLDGTTGSARNGDIIPKGFSEVNVSNFDIPTSLTVSFSFLSYYYGWMDMQTNSRQGNKAQGEGQTIHVVIKHGSKHALED